MLLRDTSQGFVLSQIASFINWVASICLTVVVGQNWCSVMLDSRDPKNMFLSVASLYILRICIRNLIRSPVFMLSSYDELMAISVFVLSLHRSRMIFITNFLLAISSSHSWDFTIGSWLCSRRSWTSTYKTNSSKSFNHEDLRIYLPLGKDFQEYSWLDT